MESIYLVTWVRDAFYRLSGYPERASQTFETLEEARDEVKLHPYQDPIVYEAILFKVK